MIIFGHFIPTVIIWIGTVLSIAVLIYSFWRYVNLSITTIILIILRLLFIGVLTWCLFQPELKHSMTNILKPRFIVAVDTSKSMLLTPSEDISNRWTVAKQALNQPWTTIIGAACDIDLYPFSVEVGNKVDITDVKKLVPDGASSLLRNSLRKLTDRYKGQNVSGLLLLSDGIDTREVYDDWAGESWLWPIYTLRLEPEAAWDVEPDVRVDAINTPRRVTVGWSTELKAVISGQGTKGSAVNVRLLKNGVIVQESPIQLPSEGGTKEVPFHLEHPSTGSFTYKIMVPPLPGESHTNDNSYAVSVQVIDARNRLLYVEGSPRWESKYLTRALKLNSQVTPLCFLRGPNRKFITIGTRGSMTTDMRESQLAFFKIVILGNLYGDELGNRRAESLVKFTLDGGSLILLGGAKAWGSSGFSSTPLKKLLPVKNHGNRLIEGKYPVELTDTGRSHPAFAGDMSFWETVPPVLSVFPDIVLSAGAEDLVCVNTPKGKLPIIIVNRYGQGKVIAIFTDSLWKWKLNPSGSKHYQRFWDQLVSWLLPEEKELAPQQLDIFVDKEQIFLGEEIDINARMGGSKEKHNKDIIIGCEITTPDNRKIPFSMTKQHIITSSGKSFSGFAVKFTAQLPGLYSAIAVADISGKKTKSNPISFFVKPFTPESIPKPANTVVLELLTKHSGGKYFNSIKDLNEGLSSLSDFATREEEMVKYSSLWQNFIILSCLIALLSIEWGIRKWKNMP